MRLTEEDLARILSRKTPEPAGSPSKYKNEKVKADGEVFDSKREFQRYCRLKMLERGRQISGLRRQVPFELAPSVILSGVKKRALTYKADFVYTEDGREVVEDSKGCITDVFRIKQHLMKSVFNIDILLT